MKLYPFPQPQLHLRRRATSTGSAEKYWDHRTHVIRWLDRNALRRIHEARKLTGRFPTVDELQDWLEVHCAEARHYFDDCDRMAEDAAVFALSVFDQAEYDRRVARAVNGGKKSRRGKSFTTDQLREVEGLSITQQAAKLGCSVATIKRIRARLKAENSAAYDAEVDAIVGPVEAAQPAAEAEDDDLLAQLDAADTIPESTEPVIVPDHVPVDWTALILKERAEAEARATFDLFADIEVSL